MGVYKATLMKQLQHSAAATGSRVQLSSTKGKAVDPMATAYSMASVHRTVASKAVNMQVARVAAVHRVDLV